MNIYDEMLWVVIGIVGDKKNKINKRVLKEKKVLRHKENFLKICVLKPNPQNFFTKIKIANKTEEGEHMHKKRQILSISFN
jgi:hypothetical protein